MYTCTRFTLEYQIVVLICYAFHVVLYDFNHLVEFEINIYRKSSNKRRVSIKRRSLIDAGLE